MVDIDYTSFDDFGFSEATAQHGASGWVTPPPPSLFVLPSSWSPLLLSRGPLTRLPYNGMCFDWCSAGKSALSGQDLRWDKQIDWKAVQGRTRAAVVIFVLVGRDGTEKRSQTCRKYRLMKTSSLSRVIILSIHSLKISEYLLRAQMLSGFLFSIKLKVLIRVIDWGERKMAP